MEDFKKHFLDVDFIVQFVNTSRVVLLSYFCLVYLFTYFLIFFRSFPNLAPLFSFGPPFELTPSKIAFYYSLNTYLLLTSAELPLASNPSVSSMYLCVSLLLSIPLHYVDHQYHLIECQCMTAFFFQLIIFHVLVATGSILMLLLLHVLHSDLLSSFL